MVTRNNVYTPLNESSQCIKICIWFPRHVFKDIVLFFAMRSLSKSNYTENPWKLGQLWYQSGADLPVTSTLLIT